MEAWSGDDKARQQLVLFGGGWYKRLPEESEDEGR